MRRFSMRMAGVVLVGCLLVAVSARGATETVVYSFQSGGDGNVPQAGLINVGGKFYGTSYAGGGTGCGCGTVFWVTKAGAEKVVHSFKGGSDGSYPNAGLVDVGGTLYGTTYRGGKSKKCGTFGCGTVFSVTKAGVEKVVYSFKSGSDGAGPLAGLTNLSGTLFGTTSYGGSTGCGAGCGTVFSVTPAGVEKVVHAFQGGNDGDSPFAAMIYLGGTLYGTTQYGGGTGCNNAAGCGAVFSVTPTGVENVVHSFQGGSDGETPRAGLIKVGGGLYGTTEQGGGSANCNGGCGTVFSVTPAGAEKVVYAFQGGNDGAFPVAGLISLGGALYGTTLNGGVNGPGSVFSVTTSGVETVLHSFGGTDGSEPEAGLINVAGLLYGTTAYGGANGVGTVFSVTR